VAQRPTAPPTALTWHWQATSEGAQPSSDTTDERQERAQLGWPLKIWAVARVERAR
jgi:hypothetical protein